MKLRASKALVLAGSAVLLGLSLTGCSALDGLFGTEQAQRDEDGNVIEETTIGIFDLQVGDCMPSSTSASGEIESTLVVPCSEPHVSEVFFDFELEDGELPSEEEITAEVEAQCVPAFNSFVGVEYADSTLDFWWLTPTEETWNDADDRLVQCVIYEPDPADETGETPLEITDSLEGAAR